MRTGYVSCKVAPGFFETEFYVTVGASSVHADRGTVRVSEPPPEGGEVDGSVLVYVVEEPSGKDSALVELPGEPVVGGLRSWVPKSLLSP
jgi:hypothetical protein